MKATAAEVSAFEAARNVCSRYVDSDVLGIAVGGSIARGDEIPGSDIDLLIFDERETCYRKSFDHVCGWPIEIHYIPSSLPAALVGRMSSLITPVPFIEKNAPPLAVFGEKRCPLDPRCRPQLQLVLSAWRELRKLLDSVPLTDSAWLRQLQREYTAVRVDVSAFHQVLGDLETHHDVFWAAVSVLQLDAMFRQQVLSKVMWVDRWLGDRRNTELTAVFSALISAAPTTPVTWLEMVHDCVCEMTERCKQRYAICNVCQNEIRRCCLARCALDYFADARRAAENDWKLGLLLSMRKAIENAQARIACTGQTPNGLSQDWEQFWNIGDAERRRQLAKLVAIVHRESQ